MKFPRPQHQEPSEFGGGSGAEVGSADRAPRTSTHTRAPRHNKHPTNKYTNEKNNNAKAHALHRHVFNGLACCLAERSGVSRSTRARRRRRSREVAWISYAYDPMFLSKTNVPKIDEGQVVALQRAAQALHGVARVAEPRTCARGR